jgi:coenzyme PQQ precursor peptide PqqA
MQGSARNALAHPAPLEFNRKCHQRWWRKIIMKWETPTLVEICIGLEINGYLPAEF